MTARSEYMQAIMATHGMSEEDALKAERVAFNRLHGYGADERHEAAKLFEPAPEQMAGQLGFDDEPTI